MNARNCFMRLCLLCALALPSALLAAVVSNQPPVAVNDNINVNAGALTPINVLANDFDPNLDPISIWNFTPPIYGTVFQMSNQLWYQAYSNYCGTDSFTYNITDGVGGFSSNATVLVNVTGCMSNQPPVANNDFATVASGVSTFINVLTNDYDPEFNFLSIWNYSQPFYGSVTPSGSGFYYQSMGGFTGSDSFGYTVTDNQGGYSSATVSVTVTNGGMTNPPASADVSMSKYTPPGNVSPGDQITYTLYTYNAGPGTSTNVVVRDAIPSGTVYVSASGGNCTYYPNFQRVDCDIGNLGAGSWSYVFVTVQVTNTGAIVNFANAYGTTPDSNTTNNASGVTNMSVAASADLSMTKWANPSGAVGVGDQITYTLYAYNAGPNLSSNVVVRDAIPSGTVYVSASGGNCTYYSNFQRVDCDVGNLAAFSSAYVYVTVQVTNAGPIVNCANAYGSTPDPSTENNVHCATNVTTQLSADLELTKSASSNAVLVGQQFTFTLRLTNAGPSSVTNQVIVTEQIPSGFEYVGDTSGAFGDYYSFGLEQWVLPNGVPAFAGRVLAITVRATNAGMYTNVAVANVPGGITDPNTNNNRGMVVVTVTTPTAELRIGKTASTNTVKVGQQFVFTLSLTNGGPDTVTNDVAITDVIPDAFHYVGDTSGGANGSYSWGLGQWTVVPGASGTVRTITITVLATNVGTFTNVAIINVPPGLNDPNTNNNVGAAAVTVSKPQADLRISKSANTNAVRAGSNIVFTLSLSNGGPDSVTNQITVADAIPAGCQYVSDTSGGSYSAGQGLWFVTPGASGAVVSIGITVKTIAMGPYTNTATINVPASVSDPNVNNNTASVVVTNLPTFKITGKVLDCMTNGPGLTNVTLTLVGNGLTNATMSGSNGSYMFTNLPPFTNYVITPSLTNYTFLPTNLIVNLTNDITVSNIIGFSFVVRGLVREGTNPPVVPMPATLITLMATNGSLMRSNYTDTNGIYVFTNVPAGVYKMMAFTNGYKFVPTNLVLLTLTNSLSLTNCTNTVNFVGETKRIELRALEVVQVVQDWTNSVRLIESKRTYVRAHVQLHPTNTMPMAADGFRLRGFRDGSELAGSPRTPMNEAGAVLVRTNAMLLRNQWTNSVDFDLPAAWTRGTIMVRVEWTNGVFIYREPAEAGGTPSNGAVTVSFVASRTPQVKWFSVNWTNLADGTTNKVSDASGRDLVPRLISVYPIREVDSVPADGSMAPMRWEGANPPDVGDVLDHIRRARNLDAADPNRIYYGAIPGAQISGVAKVGFNWGTGYLPPGTWDEGRHTHSHEIAHSLGEHHTMHPTFGFVTNRPPGGPTTTNFGRYRGYCSESAPTNAPVFPFKVAVNGRDKPLLGPETNGNGAIYGLDTLALDARREPVVDPLRFFELMSYCSSPGTDLWSSSHTYERLRTSINARYAPPGPDPSKGIPGPLPFLLVGGSVDFLDGSVRFLPFIEAVFASAPPSEPPGAFLLQMLNGTGDVLYETTFAPATYDARGDEPERGSFFISVPAHSLYRQARVIFNGQVVAARIASANRPDLELLTANGGGVVTPGPLPLNWSAFDADGDSLTYYIQFSADDGLTWETIDVEWPRQNYIVEHSQLRATTAGRFRIIVSDGFYSDVDQSDGSFTVQNHPPQARLVAPITGEGFYADQALTLVADVRDMEDGDLSGAQVQWTSSLNGPLGSGSLVHLSALDLAEGQHVITLSGTDSGGLNSSASVTIWVLREAPPVLRIARDESNVRLAWSASLTDYILQASTNLTSPNWITVTNTPVIVGEEKTVTRSADGASRYYRLFRP